MSIFNSLGSNYDLRFVLKSLLGSGKKADNEKLKALLEERYDGKAYLFYKGREALTFALELLKLPSDSKIAINGFTCVAVFNAIRKAGFEPICLDLEEKGGLNFTPKNLEECLKKEKNLRVVVVQNTLGYPCEIEKIKSICEKNNLILIEDLAHSVGTRYENGGEAGTVGDFTVLSFSQDKIVDAICGGALVVRNNKYLNLDGGIKINAPKTQIRDRFYPLITLKIRLLYGLRIGKIYHFLVKRFGLLTNIMNESFYNYYKLPSFYAMLANASFANLKNQLSHRRKIAQIYASLLPDKIFMFPKEKTQEAVFLSSNLRFPIFIDNREDLINSLKKRGINVADIWYSDVAPQCRNAVNDSKKILNLPTHINVSVRHAEIIAKEVNKWLRSA